MTRARGTFDSRFRGMTLPGTAPLRGSEAKLHCLEYENFAKRNVVPVYIRVVGERWSELPVAQLRPHANERRKSDYDVYVGERGSP